jgi:VanZ family protein
MMLVIFLMSARSPSELPNFHWADGIVKKGAHVIVYGLLALLYWRAFELKTEKRRVAWFLAVLYAVTDEFHQSFAPGRNPSLWDVVLFDNLGAVLALWLADRHGRQNQSGTLRRIVEDTRQ